MDLEYKTVRAIAKLFFQFFPNLLFLMGTLQLPSYNYFMIDLVFVICCRSFSNSLGLNATVIADGKHLLYFL